ncbi:replicative DNA helicase [Micromonospora sp. NBRC 107095]|uniref:replicative DNA helicase n=1 Tax=Micromonospora sp. NBRC 107095 TaxID=3032209 RepID=UPI00249FDB57|nr:replicative DNA helicase [Micromonospora sp. NBRC 107095]GLZ62849.1 replicative DNA helicase [Micromonospora sp. NBRC 107095]
MTITTEDHDLRRTPPQDTAAERIVLGAMMLARDAIADVIELVTADEYYRPAHGTIHRAITDLYVKGEPTDAAAVAAKLLTTGDLQRVGGAPYLFECIEAVPTVANAGWHAKRIRNDAGRRRLAEVGTKMVSLALNPGVEYTEAVDQAGQSFYDATTRHDSGELTPLSALIGPTLEAISAAAANPDSVIGLPTGLVDLDRLTGGLRPGQLVVVAGRPGMGKSVFGVDVARNIAIRAGKPVAFFALEMGEDELIQRILSAETLIPLHALRDAKHLSDLDWRRLAEAETELAAAPLHIDPTPSVNMTEIRARARRLAQRKGLSLIVVDYLQLMTPARKSESRQQEVAEISRGMKLLAKELQVPVIAVAQLNRDNEKRQDKRPMLADLRESGALEQDADLVIFVHRDDYYDKESARAGEVDLIVAKNRSGPQDTITAAAQLHVSRFVDMCVL